MSCFHVVSRGFVLNATTRLGFTIQCLLYLKDFCFEIGDCLTVLKDLPTHSPSCPFLPPSFCPCHPFRMFLLNHGLLAGYRRRFDGGQGPPRRVLAGIPRPSSPTSHRQLPSVPPPASRLASYPSRRSQEFLNGGWIAAKSWPPEPPLLSPRSIFKHHLLLAAVSLLRAACCENREA